MALPPTHPAYFLSFVLLQAGLVFETLFEKNFEFFFYWFAQNNIDKTEMFIQMFIYCSFQIRSITVKLQPLQNFAADI